jgi:putative endonuclease
MATMAHKAKSTPEHIETGQIGEKLAAQYLINQGFDLVARNYRKKWGEIDVRVSKDNKIHFVEVKTVSYGTKQDLHNAVSYGTWRPEENVHPFKLKKLSRAIESWLMEQKYDGYWQIDVVAVRIVPRETLSTIKMIENIIVE